MGRKDLIEGKHLGVENIWGMERFQLKENICGREKFSRMKTFGRGKHLGRKDLIDGKHLGEENI